MVCAEASGLSGAHERKFPCQPVTYEACDWDAQESDAAGCALQEDLACAAGHRLKLARFFPAKDRARLVQANQVSLSPICCF